MTVTQEDMIMKPLFDKLLMLLGKETDLYEGVLELMKQEKAAVLESNPETLTDHTEKKDSLLLEIQALERQRQRVVQDLATSLGCPTADMRLRDLSQAAEEPYASRLEACRSRLLRLAKTISVVSADNLKLITHSLDRVRNSFSFLQQLTSPNTVYHNTGKIHTSDRSGRLLSNEI
ncbi:MAG: flagellar protein FlgN [Desulfatiglandaceae bacterium]